jgi:hypothetical protein
MANTPSFKDRLSDSLDKWLFVGCFVGGAFLILLTKSLLFNVLVPVGVGVAVLVLYAVSAWRSPRFRLREDRAGDSAYYLGFLFTLVSLSYALWEFGRGGQNLDRIISSFAVALATTIAGLVVRVMFQQLREDPYEYEEEGRLALAEASQQLKTQVLSAIEDISAFRTRLHQELNESSDAAASSRRQFNKLDAVLERTISSEEDIREKQRAMAANVLTVLASTNAAVASLHGDVLANRKAVADLTSSTKASVSAVDAFAPRVLGAAKALEKTILAQETQLEGLTRAARESLATVEAANRQLGGAVSASSNAITAIHKEVVAAAQTIVRELNGSIRPPR